MCTYYIVRCDGVCDDTAPAAEAGAGRDNLTVYTRKFTKVIETLVAEAEGEERTEEMNPVCSRKSCSYKRGSKLNFNSDI